MSPTWAPVPGNWQMDTVVRPLVPKNRRRPSAFIRSVGYFAEEVARQPDCRRVLGGIRPWDEWHGLSKKTNVR